MVPPFARRHRFPWLLLLAALLCLGPSSEARQAAKEQYDQDFARLVKEWTTKPEFLSPLVDHLPRKAGVPTTKDVLGYYVGEPRKLTYWADQGKWYRALEKALPGRVKTTVVGKTEEGREIMVVFVTSDGNLKSLEQNRLNMRKIADRAG